MRVVCSQDPGQARNLAAEFYTYGNLIRVDIAERGKKSLIENIERRKISMGTRTSTNKSDHKVPKLKKKKKKKYIDIYNLLELLFFCTGMRKIIIWEKCTRL